MSPTATNYLIGCMRKDQVRNEEDALKEIYRRMRPGDPTNINNAKLLIKRLFFDNRRYDLGAVGRYKLNERLKQDIPLTQRVLDPKDLMAATKMLIKLRHSGGQVDDIDHLGAVVSARSANCFRTSAGPACCVPSA